MHRKYFRGPHLVWLFLLATSFPVFAQAPGYHVVKKFELGGDGGWDYISVDSASRRLFVARATRIMVVDAGKGTLLGEIPDTPGAHGVALAPELNRGFASSGRAASVSIFDLKELKVLSKVSVGQNPDAILYEPHTRRVFVFNGRSQDASVIEAASGTVASTIPLGGKPEFGVTDDAGQVYVNIEDKSEIVSIDPQKMAVVARWPLNPCEEPSGLAIDRKKHRLFSVCSNKLMAVVDTTSGRLLATVPIGAGTDGAGFDAASGLAFSSNGEGTITVVGEDAAGKFSAVESVSTQRSARTMVVDPQTHLLYLPAATYGPPPAATPEQPRPRPTVVPGSFVVLVVGR